MTIISSHVYRIRLQSQLAPRRAPARILSRRRQGQEAYPRQPHQVAARDSLAETLALNHCDEDDLYAAMNWLLERQDAIERRLAKRHLDDGALVLYDLTSVYLEGRCCPVAVEVFDGNTADPATVGVQIDKLRRRFGLSRVVLVGDRGMLTEARIRDEVEPAGLDWISALRGSAVRALVESGSVQLSLFDQTDLVEIRSPEYPGERLMVCRNPLLAEERKRKREALLRATEALLDPIVAATQRDQRRLKGKEKNALRPVGRRTASAPCSTTWPPSLVTESSRACRVLNRSMSSLDPPRYSARPSDCSAFDWKVPSRETSVFLIYP